ncbi:MAG: adenylate/guanylate cyclase domain-containing protein [Candidatus Promineifilaceae bacterium]
MSTAPRSTNPGLRTLAVRLASYLPIPLTQQILRDDLPTPGQPQTFVAATLFADISGFTRLTELLATDGPRGAEELNRVLQMTFTAMINGIHTTGGEVAHFHGDAMSIYFPDDDNQAAARALACAQLMQRLMQTSFREISVNQTPKKRATVELTMKIGLGYGMCLAVVVGEVGQQLEFVLAGPAVDEAVAAQERAKAGEVVASRAIHQRAGLPAPADFVVTEAFLPMVQAPLALFWDAYNTAQIQRLNGIAAAFLPPALAERISATEISFVAEHRLVTSVFVKFTGPDFHDPNIGEILQSYYQWASQIVQRYSAGNGHLNRVLTGDKGNQLHIIFGAPVAPAAPLQAIRCALALQREKPDSITSQQIGLATGHVFACAVGSTTRREYTTVGQAVNMSARLAQACPLGEVLTDEATTQRVGQSVRFAPLHAIRLKGRETPITAYRVEEIHNTLPFVERWSANATGEAYHNREFYVREQELLTLLGRLDEALAGNGGLVALADVSGSDTAELVTLAVRYWQERQGIVLPGVGESHMSDMLLGLWQPVWRHFFGLRVDMTPLQQANQVVAHTRRDFPAGAERVGLWGGVLDLPIAKAEAFLHITAAANRQPFFDLVRGCLLGAAARQPLLLVLQDIHWADQLSLDLLDDLVNSLNDTRLFVLLTYRSARRPSLKMLAQPHHTPIQLHELDEQEALILLRQWLGDREIPYRLEQTLGLRNEHGQPGTVTPFFLAEMINLMLKTEVITLNGNQVILHEDRLAQLPVPETAYSFIQVRLDRLPARLRNILQVVAVIGREFDLESLLPLLSGQPRDEVVALLDELMHLQFLNHVPSTSQNIYLFHDALLHQVVYESLPYARRQALHVAFAEWLTGRFPENLRPFYGVLAFHYSRTDLHEKSLKYTLAAADTALNLSAGREAISLYQQAQRFLQPLGEQQWQVAVHIFLSLGQAYRWLGEFTTAESMAREALHLALMHHSVVLEAQGQNLLAELSYHQARYAAALQQANIVLYDTSKQVLPADLATAYTWAGRAALALGEQELALAHLKQAETLCVRLGDRVFLHRVWAGLAVLYAAQGESQMAFTLAQRSIAQARRLGSPVHVSGALLEMARLHLWYGEAEKALTHLAEAASLARGTSPSRLVQVLLVRARAVAYLGRYSDMLTDLEEVAEVLPRMDDAAALIETHLLWAAEYHLPQKGWAEARSHFATAQASLEMSSPGEPDLLVGARLQLWLGMASLEWRAGTLERANLFLNAAATLLQAYPRPWWQTVLFYLQGVMALAQGEKDVAVGLLRQAQAEISQGGNPDYQPLILWALSEGTTSERERIAFLAQSVQSARQRGRWVDKLELFAAAGPILSQHPEYHDLGESCLRWVETGF